MIRSFIAIPLPDGLTDRLMDLQDGVKNARWIDADSLHITLLFLGDCDRRDLADLDAGLAGMRMERFALVPKGVGAFGGAKPRLLYADFASSEPLLRLHGKVERIARAAGIEVERRKFVPHVTLARCGGGVIPAQALDWTVRNNLFEDDPFEVTSFSLYRSDLGTGAAVYTELMRYDLAEPTTAPG